MQKNHGEIDKFNSTASLSINFDLIKISLPQLLSVFVELFLEIYTQTEE